MPGAQLHDTRRAKRRVGSRITLAALFVSLAGLIVVTLEFVSVTELALQHVADGVWGARRLLLLTVILLLVFSVLALALALQALGARSRLEHALAASERRVADGERFLSQITDNLAVRIAYFDAHARYRFVNLAHCKRYGKTRAGSGLRS